MEENRGRVIKKHVEKDPWTKPKGDRIKGGMWGCGDGWGRRRVVGGK